MVEVTRALERLGPNQGYTYLTLAQIAYATPLPTRAQLSAVRRSVERLAQQGIVRQAMSDSDPSVRIIVFRPGLTRSRRALDDGHPPDLAWRD